MKKINQYVSPGINIHIILFAVAASIIFAFYGAQDAKAANQIVQTFYVPVPEQQLRTWEANLSAHTGTPITDTTVNGVISITATMDGTIIYYDQWEDGYETNISNPQQSTTQVWGDGDYTNGTPPGCTCTANPCACDVINAGTVITLQNSVPLVQNGTSTSYVRNQGSLYFDAGDKIASTGQLVITRAGWTTPTGTVLSGAVEVADTRKWGTSFTLPVGANSNTGVVGAMFDYAAVSIMAQNDNTVVTVTDSVTAAITTYTLNQGQSVYIDSYRNAAYGATSPVNQGTTLSATGPIQVDMMTGDPTQTYEGRWFSLIPQSQWSNSYYSPVPTVTTHTASVLFYNPGTTPITVNVAYNGGTTTVTVPGSSGTPPNIARYNMPQNTGAHFYTTGSPAPSFFAFFTNDYNSPTYEWAAMMTPETSLTPSVVVGWAPGYDMNYAAPTPPNVDVVWVTPVATTTIYVNYSGNPNIGNNTDPYGNKYDVSYNVNALQSQKISNTTTNNMTGARIYTVDGTRIAAFWGEDGSTGVTGTPGMDLGTAVLPFPSLTAYKTATLIGDYNSNGGIDPGELLQYTIRIHNSGIIPITNIVLTDTLDSNVNYVANTTGYSTSQSGPFTPIADNPFGTSPLLSGYTIVTSPAQLNPGQDMYVTFQVTVDNPLSSGVTSLLNTVTVTSTSLQQLTVVSENFTNTVNSAVEQGALATVKTANPSGTVNPGNTIAYTITVTNTSTTPQTGITLNDPLPAGATYVSNSTSAVGHLLKYVKDMFNQVSYTNNDGPQSWNGGWSESDGSPANPSAGNVQVVNGSLRLTATNSWASRAVNLTTGISGQNFTSATLTFNYSTSPSTATGDTVQVQASSNGGSTWTTLGTLSGFNGQTNGSGSYDISSYIGSGTAIRFLISTGYTGATDFFYVDNVTVKTNELSTAVTKNNTATGSSYLTNGVPPPLCYLLTALR